MSSSTALMVYSCISSLYIPASLLRHVLQMTMKYLIFNLSKCKTEILLGVAMDVKQTKFDLPSLLEQPHVWYSLNLFPSFTKCRCYHCIHILQLHALSSRVHQRPFHTVLRFVESPFFSNLRHVQKFHAISMETAAVEMFYLPGRFVGFHKMTWQLSTEMHFFNQMQIYSTYEYVYINTWLWNHPYGRTFSFNLGCSFILIISWWQKKPLWILEFPTKDIGLIFMNICQINIMRFRSLLLILIN